MRRRTYLTATTLSLTALAGCSGPLGGSDDSDVGDDPEATLRVFLTETIEGDRDRARELIHPDGPMSEATGDTLQEPGRITVRVEGEPRGTLDEIIGSPIEPGDSGTIPVPEDTEGELELYWDNGDRRQLIGATRKTSEHNSRPSVTLGGRSGYSTARLVGSKIPAVVAPRSRSRHATPGVRGEILEEAATRGRRQG